MNYYAMTKDDYKFLNKMQFESRLPFNFLIEFLDKRKHSYRPFKKGDFNVNRYGFEEAEIKINQIVEISTLVRKITNLKHLPIAFFKAVDSLINDDEDIYDHQKFLSKLNRCRDEVLMALTLRLQSHIYDALLKIKNKYSHKV